MKSNWTDLIFTDLHLGADNNSESMLEASLMLAREIHDTCVKQNINRICFLGDFFNDRRSLNTKTISYAHEFIELLNGFEVNIVIGNHDVYFKNSPKVHSLQMFKKHKNVNVVEAPLKISDKTTLVPWSATLEGIETPIVMGHFEINGCPMDNGYEHEGGNIGIDDFSKFEMVLSGHFHKPSKRGNIHYIGAVMQFNFGDASQPRGYYLFDEGTLEMKFIEFHDYPKYIILRTDRMEEITKQAVEGNNVRLAYMEELSTSANENMSSFISAFNPNTFSTDFRALKNVKMDDEEEIKNTDDEPLILKSNLEILFDYIDEYKHPVDINPIVLKQVMKQLYDQSKSNDL